MTICCCCMSVQSDSRHIKRKHTSSTGLTCLDFRMCVCLNEEIKGISEVDTWLHLTAAVQYQQSLTKSAGQNYKGCHYGPGTTTATTFACPQGVSHIHTLFVWLHSAEEMYSMYVLTLSVSRALVAEQSKAQLFSRTAFTCQLLAFGTLGLPKFVIHHYSENFNQWTNKYI